MRRHFFVALGKQPMVLLNASLNVLKHVRVPFVFVRLMVTRIGLVYLDTWQHLIGLEAQ